MTTTKCGTNGAGCGRDVCNGTWCRPIEPVCVFHGKRKSEHLCLFCCLCFTDLTKDGQPDWNRIHQLPDGDYEDVCNDCAKLEAEHRPD